MQFTFLKVVWSTLVSMVLAMVNASMIKWVVIEVLELVVAKYERRAKASPTPDDDERAAMFKEGLDKLKEVWKDI